MRGNGRTRADNTLAAAFAREAIHNTTTSFVVLYPNGHEFGRYTDVLDARDQERALGAGACMVTPEGRLLSYRAEAETKRSALAMADKTVAAWTAARAVLS